MLVNAQTNCKHLTHCRGISLAVGSPEPLGPSRQGSVTNFAVFSHAATAMSLVLQNTADDSRQEIPMNKSGTRGCCHCLVCCCCAVGDIAHTLVVWCHRILKATALCGRVSLAGHTGF
eukprot:GHUV01048734.1.p1 GENE.GHUV01048734.1~~GHUV01048734.1.p1  ORF type:complete len:118 (-),score=19.02 GHUV01048734.1:872-1225(-)